MTTRKTERPPRLIPSGQVHHELNPIFAQIVNLVKQTKNPEHFKRDLLIDKRQIAQRKPNSVLWGVRSTGTDLVCLSKGGHKGAVYTCRCCGKKTRETGEGESSVECCAKCYYEGGLENEHSDNDGVHQFGYGKNITYGKHPDCPLCKETIGKFGSKKKTGVKKRRK